MSQINGDKARFHRKRKDRIARRARNRQRLAVAESKRSGAGAETKKGPAA